MKAGKPLSLGRASVCIQPGQRCHPRRALIAGRHSFSECITFLLGNFDRKVRFPAAVDRTSVPGFAWDHFSGCVVKRATVVAVPVSCGGVHPLPVS